ncbi:cysteine desulfurase family protein [Rubrivivax gelatinosus]|uniref:Cysteine desulfurase NifS n=1 Tax=Rubrivivax gelatinosus TaxID=28068 RepID=A0ABS1DZ97_RUBGE|nr:cysteine desulfurase family protein [Rubrivivax gelatinosus]MBK1714694.1 cysteine desulfurase NifS [Rubrivivax gelatinosus]
MNRATIYLDHNATTAPAPEAVAAMLHALEVAWANPSSTHEPGQQARRLLADARDRVASFLGCQPAELVFTSGATEANHSAVLGALHAARGTRRERLVLSAVEHPGLLALAARLEGEGVPVTRLPVHADGRLDLDAARAAITPDVALVSVMGANNETGVLMPTAELAELAHAAGTRLHVDATQLAGKAALDFAASGADLMSLSAHKLHGPKGIGALVVRKGFALPPLLCGRQERKRRGGTENLPGIAGFAAACDRAAATRADDVARMAALRALLETGLAALPGVQIYGARAPRIANTSCLRFGMLDAELVLGRLERAGVVASSGAACSAGGTLPSHVLLAMGEPAEHARAALRFSLGRDSSEAELRHTVAVVHELIGPLLEPAAQAA